MKFAVLLTLTVLVQVSLGRNIDESPFIVGGSPADIADFPHSLALHDRARYWCGASIIHLHWALSAAHCLHSNTPANLITLYGGSTSRLTGGQFFTVQRYILHPSYVRATLDFDVALLETPASSPFAGIPNVSPVRISPVCNGACCQACAPGNQITVAGWGRTDGGGLPENLLQVSKAILTNQVCLNYWNFITNRMFCTLIEDGRDSCNGDSGSAAVRDGIQVGIVSFGSSVCGDGSRPAGYVRVEEPGIRNWIASFVTV